MDERCIFSFLHWSEMLIQNKIWEIKHTKYFILILADETCCVEHVSMYTRCLFDTSMTFQFILTTHTSTSHNISLVSICIIQRTVATSTHAKVF